MPEHKSQRTYTASYAFFGSGSGRGFVQDPFGVRLGSVRDPFGIRSGAVWGPFGVRLRSKRKNLKSTCSKIFSEMPLRCKEIRLGSDTTSAAGCRGFMHCKVGSIEGANN